MKYDVFGDFDLWGSPKQRGIIKQLMYDVTNYADQKSDLDTRGINLMYPPLPLIGAVGDGVTDDTLSIQNLINYVNTNMKVRKIFIPKGDYLISAPITLNGCSLEGVRSNIYSDEEKGSCFIAKTNDFIAIKQGSLKINDIQLSLSDLYVKNAKIGYEINYIINSKFNNLYARDCDIGYKLGDLTSVGSMFCEFNNFYTVNTRIGVIVQAKDYFNNNRFNNGFITGTEKAFHLEVIGGYGAVNNTFNNVELKSTSGRGIVLTSANNTTFNHCYFEDGGNAIRTTNFCTVNINECIFGMTKKDNLNADTSFVYAEGGLRMSLRGGTLFLSDQNDNTTFFDASIVSVHSNITVVQKPMLQGSPVNFKLFNSPVREMEYKREEQFFLSNTAIIPPYSSVVLDVAFPTPFGDKPNVVIPIMRGNAGEEDGVTFLLVMRSINGVAISIKNSSAKTKYVSFDILAKLM